jgi:hypothetical protein
LSPACVSKWHGYSDTAELELDEGDEGSGRAKAGGEAGEESNAVVGRLGACICEAGLEGRLDAFSAAAYRCGELGEWWETAASRPSEPAGERGDPFVALLADGLPHRLLEQVAAVERAVEPLDGGEARLLAAGQVLGVTFPPNDGPLGM